MKTCKTHTILSALRKLREDGFIGKINTAMIRELTGIESPGRSLCELRDKGYLLNAGEIKLPASRGTTTANMYLINPKSDLMPLNKYDVSAHNRKLRGNGMAQNNKTSEIRKTVKSYNGAIFSTTQVRKDIGMYAHTHQRLEYLASLGEIKRVEKVKTGGRSSLTWKEIKINESLIYNEPIAPVYAKQSSNPWAIVWPEFFSLPKMQGTLRSFAVTDF